MALDFNALMTNVKSTFSSEKKPTKDYNDKRFVKVTRDEDDNGTLVVRLIPNKEGVGVVTTFKHFGSKVDEKGNTRYFIAECPTTIEQKCPYCEKYLNAWKAKDHDTIESLKNGKRSEKYITNVLVVKDPGNPENNGRVMLFEFGYKISQLIEQAMNGDPEAEIDPINIFHPIEGANLLIKHSKSGKQIVLDGTKFLSPSSVVSDMDEFETILEKTYSLQEFLDPSKFESYEELEKKMFKYENGYDLEESAGTKPKPAQTTQAPKVEAPVAKPEPKVEAPVETPKPKPAPSVDDDDDFFANL